MKGRASIPGDKSISQRAIILGGLAGHGAGRITPLVSLGKRPVGYGLRFLKIISVAMAVLIVIGTTVVVVTIARRIGAPAAPVQIAVRDPEIAESERECLGP